MEPITITITGHPVAQGRGRAAIVAGHATVYKPGKSRRWEQDARQLARITMGARPNLRGPLSMQLWAVFTTPASWPTWKREAALAQRIEPSCKPDLDNLVKAAKDALNGVVWDDDAQVVHIEAWKLYGPSPHVKVQVWRRATNPAHVNSKKALE